jgi:hypothetical protein
MTEQHGRLGRCQLTLRQRQSGVCINERGLFGERGGNMGVEGCERLRVWSKGVWPSFGSKY